MTTLAAIAVAVIVFAGFMTSVIRSEARATREERRRFEAKMARMVEDRHRAILR